MAGHETNSRMTGTVKGVAFAILGLTGLSVMEQIASGLGSSFGILLAMALEMAPSVLLAAWHILQPCVFVHIGFLERLLEISFFLVVRLALPGAA